MTDLSLGQVDYLLEVIEDHADELNINEQWSHDFAHEAAKNLTLIDYKKALALIYNEKFAEARAHLKKFDIL